MWSDIEEIVENLEETYSEEEIPSEDDLPYLQEMVLSLSDFEDHEIEVDQERLKRIMEYWLERRG
ncbi:MAG: Fe-S cluster assembly protein IscX [Rickettsiaceae bacterium]